MRNFFTILSNILLVAILLAGSARDAFALKGFEVGVRGYYWDVGLDASMASLGDTIDLKDDLQMGDEEFVAGEAFLRWGRSHFIVAYSTVSFDGLGTITKDFSGATFTGQVASRLEYDQIDGIYQYDLIRYNPVIATFNLGVLLQVKYVDGFAELEEKTGTLDREREEFSVPIPMIGLGGGVGIVNDTVVLEARVAGLEYSGNRAIDFHGLVGVIPFPFMKIFGGYKVFDLKVDEDDFRIDYTIDGPFAGVQLSF